MEIQRALIDKEFDRYVLSTTGVQKLEFQLPKPVLQPLDAANTTRKAQWEARVHSNGLTADAFRSDALGGSVVYYVDEEFRVMQALCSKTNGLKLQMIYELPQLKVRKENVTIQVAGLGLLAINDGNGAVRIIKSGNAAAEGAPWETVYEFQPLAQSPSLLLKAYYDEKLQRFKLVLAEPLANGDIEASFRLSVVDVSSAAADDAMDVDSGAMGVQHSVFEVAVTSTLPNFLVFNGPDLAMLVEGTCNVMIEAKNPVPVPQATTDVAHTPKRHHDESDLEMDVDEVLAKVPRAGIGYHGDISDVKHPNDLAHDLDLAKSLSERFRKSSIPYSSLDEPLHSTSSEAVRSPTSQAREGTLEVPTPDTILGGFEECDDVDPNAKAVILLIDTVAQSVQDKLDVNCRNFRYLTKSGPIGASGVDSSLLFQNDVHGLVFELDVSGSRLKLRHTTTFPAFGFVQASKQDKKYVTFDPATRFACIGEFEKRLFVYHGAPAGQEKDAHVRNQNVVEIGEHQLLGMCTVGSSILLLSPHHIHQVDVVPL